MAALMHHHSGIAVHAPDIDLDEWRRVLNRAAHTSTGQCIEHLIDTKETMNKGTGGQAAIKNEAEACAAEEAARAERRANRRSGAQPSRPTQSGPARQNKLAPERW